MLRNGLRLLQVSRTLSKKNGTGKTRSGCSLLDSMPLRWSLLLIFLQLLGYEIDDIRLSTSSWPIGNRVAWLTPAFFSKYEGHVQCRYFPIFLLQRPAFI